MCILKGGVVCSHIFIPIFIFFVYGYSFVFWIMFVIMGWVCYTMIMVNVCL